VIVLALDTTTRDGSIAVLHDSTVRVERRGDPTITHGQRLPSEIAEALEAAGTRLDAVDLFAVAAGPGSFTGLRVGIATIQGIAMGCGKRVVPVSALDALARSALSPANTVAAWMDAQRGEVFAALYDADGRTVLIPPVSAEPAIVLKTWAAKTALARTTFVGDGAVRHADVLHRDVGPDASIQAPPLLAAPIGRIALEHASNAVLPHAIVPIYVRRSDAELARARRGSG
jgi:tRNA threonylcarbamoyladenosine biosynthesis protein TsaB